MSYKKRRDKLEIVGDILLSLSMGNSKPTSIMYGTGMSWKSLNEQLVKLVESGLVEAHESQNPLAKTKITYTITPDGEKILSDIGTLRGLI